MWNKRETFITVQHRRVCIESDVFFLSSFYFFKMKLCCCWTLNSVYKDLNEGEKNIYKKLWNCARTHVRRKIERFTTCSGNIFSVFFFRNFIYTQRKRTFYWTEKTRQTKEETNKNCPQKCPKKRELNRKRSPFQSFVKK